MFGPSPSEPRHRGGLTRSVRDRLILSSLEQQQRTLSRTEAKSAPPRKRQQKTPQLKSPGRNSAGYYKIVSWNSLRGRSRHAQPKWPKARPRVPPVRRLCIEDHRQKLRGSVFQLAVAPVPRRQIAELLRSPAWSESRNRSSLLDGNATANEEKTHTMRPPMPWRS